MKRLLVAAFALPFLYVLPALADEGKGWFVQDSAHSETTRMEQALQEQERVTAEQQRQIEQQRTRLLEMESKAREKRGYPPDFSTPSSRGFPGNGLEESSERYR